MRSKYLVFKLVLIFGFNSCDKMNPANFWMDYDSENIIFSQGEFQGRYGYKIVDFKKPDGTYEVADMLLFSKRNGWYLHTTKNYKKENLRSWKQNDELFFKPSITGFKPNEIATEFIKVFPRFIEGSLTVYEFNTEGMVLVNSETDDITQRVGFVLLSEDKTRMTVYHLWGETNRHKSKIQ